MGPADGAFVLLSGKEAGRVPLWLPLKKNKSDDRRAYLRQSGLLSTVPFLLAVPPVAGLLIGRYIDRRFDTDPIFTIVLLVLGFVAGARETAIVIKKANRNEDSDKNDAGTRR